MTALDFLNSYPYLPSSKEGRKTGRPSRSELKRWLRSGSVIINHTSPQPHDQVEYPITELIFFPKSVTNRTTLVA